jgi:hypothetical protein
VDAVERADAIDIIRVGMWLDTGDFDLAYQTIMDKDNGDLKLSKEENWSFFWDHNIKDLVRCGPMETVVSVARQADHCNVELS